MGVDWYTCDVCGENYPDCGHCGNCKCGTSLCGDCVDKAKDKWGETDGNESKKCQNCSLDNITDRALIAYLLKKCKLTRTKIEDEMREAAKK